jgi:hypothetical protein
MSKGHRAPKSKAKKLIPRPSYLNNHCCLPVKMPLPITSLLRVSKRP